VILKGAEIGEGCILRDCIVAAGARIGARTTISGGAVLGEGVTVGADNVIAHGARIFPGVALPDGAIKF
jgi:mannose-1-phosphate guanylyltransferase